jgi:molybdopterin converting factor subunit 1
MSKVTVQLFASYAEAFGESSLQIPFDQGSTVADIVRHIRSLPAGSSLPATARVAVNRKFAAPDQVIEGSDEIAVIPPVAGG